LRGVDVYRADHGDLSFTALGASLVDIGGGHPDKAYERALAFQSLGYRVMVVRDADIPPNPVLEAEFTQNQGQVLHWQAPLFLEQQLFNSLPSDACIDLLYRAIEHHEDLVDSHLRTVSDGTMGSQTIIDEQLTTGALSQETRACLGRAASQKRGWFKNIGIMEAATRDIIAPALNRSAPDLVAIMRELSSWVEMRDA